MILMASYCDSPINTFNEYSWEIVARRRIPPILQENMEKKYPVAVRKNSSSSR
jgi:hypothetical protein